MTKLNTIRSKKEYRLHVVLDHVRKYIDRRAYISKGGVIKYSIAVREKYNRPVRFEKRVLVPENINQIFFDLYPNTPKEVN